MNLQINFMTESNLNSLSQNLILDFDDFWNFNVLKSEFENPSSTYIVAKIGDEIVGFAGIWKSVDDVHITNIVTKKNKRNLGIASQLLEKLIEISKTKKVGSITLEVNENNIPAINLYKKYNFQILGKRKKYYNNADNAIIMTLYL